MILVDWPGISIFSGCYLGMSGCSDNLMEDVALVIHPGHRKTVSATMAMAILVMDFSLTEVFIPQDC